MKFGIVMFPSKKLQDVANSYRKRYDPNYSLISPHITLKYPFKSDEMNIKSITKYLSNAASEIQPFSLNVLKASSFQPVHNTIYLKVEANEPLVQLHKLLHSGLLTSEAEYAFVPHITIGQKLSNDEHSDVFGQVSMQNFRYEETVDRFHLLYQLENGAWTVYETFLLGKK